VEPPATASERTDERRHYAKASRIRSDAWRWRRTLVPPSVRRATNFWSGGFVLAGSDDYQGGPPCIPFLLGFCYVYSFATITG
jgi:hypothetical protein